MVDNTIKDVEHGRLTTLLTRLVQPADDWAQPRSKHGVPSLLFLMGLLLLILFAAAMTGVLMARGVSNPNVLLVVLLVLLGISCAIVGVLIYQVRHHLVTPLALLRTWALSMCEGNLSARIPLPQAGEFGKLTFHINRLSDALDKLANDMDDMVNVQTQRLHEKNRSLEVLYEIAANINESDDLEDLLKRSAEKLMEMIQAKAVSVRVHRGDREMRLIAQIGFEPTDGSEPPGQDKFLSKIDAQLATRRPPEDIVIEDLSEGKMGMGVVTIPLRYQSENPGLINLFTPTPETARDAEVHKLLSSMGKHLGMAIEKARLDEESQNLSLMRERTALAHELHDSLAQTLASLRFQVKMLGETLARVETPSAKREMERIRNSVDEAHTEVRELIANFRAPIDERGLLPALKDMVERFRRDTDIATYFHADPEKLQLSAASEIQVMRIVREALSNVRKHSHARTVRILVRSDSQGNCRVIIEDDGVGLDLPVLREHPGEHIGISIMQERAKHLGAELRIESDAGEGTQVALTFSTIPNSNAEETRAGVT